MLLRIEKSEWLHSLFFHYNTIFPLCCSVSEVVCFLHLQCVKGSAGVVMLMKVFSEFAACLQICSMFYYFAELWYNVARYHFDGSVFYCAMCWILSATIVLGLDVRF